MNSFPILFCSLLSCVLLQFFASFGAADFVENETEAYTTSENSFLNKTSVRAGTKRTPEQAKKLEKAWIMKINETGKPATIDIYPKENRDPIMPAKKIRVKITRGMLRTGTGVAFEIENFDNFKREAPGAAGKASRCHIIANVLGGSGNVPSNLFPCYQNNFNHPSMSGCEGVVRGEVEKGYDIEYSVTLNYGRKFYPKSVDIEATFVANRRKLFHVQIENTPAGTIKSLSGDRRLCK